MKRFIGLIILLIISSFTINVNAIENNVSHSSKGYKQFESGVKAYITNSRGSENTDNLSMDDCKSYVNQFSGDNNYWIIAGYQSIDDAAEDYCGSIVTKNEESNNSGSSNNSTNNESGSTKKYNQFETSFNTFIKERTGGEITDNFSEESCKIYMRQFCETNYYCTIAGYQSSDEAANDYCGSIKKEIEEKQKSGSSDFEIPELSEEQKNLNISDSTYQMIEDDFMKYYKDTYTGASSIENCCTAVTDYLQYRTNLISVFSKVNLTAEELAALDKVNYDYICNRTCSKNPENGHYTENNNNNNKNLEREKLSIESLCKFSDNCNINIANFCKQGNISKTLRFLGWIFFLLKVLVPLVIIGMGIKDLFDVIVSGKEDVASKKIKSLVTRIVIGVIIFLLPGIVDFLFNTITDITKSDSLSGLNNCKTCILNPGDCYTEGE